VCGRNWEKNSLLGYGLTLKSSLIYKRNCEGLCVVACGRSKLFKASEKKVGVWGRLKE
jgi:hypothetical protein